MRSRQAHLSFFNYFSLQMYMFSNLAKLTLNQGMETFSFDYLENKQYFQILRETWNSPDSLWDSIY